MGLIKGKTMPFFARVRKFFADSLFFVGKLSKAKRPKAVVDNTDMDKKLVYSLSKSKIPNAQQLKYLDKVLNKKESFLINFFLLIILINLGWLAFSGAQKYLRIVPVSGGQYTEGLIGEPAHINPLYSSLSNTDNDISRLVYSSLFKYDGNGQLINDLAEGYQVSADGKMYVIKLKNDVRWQTGEKLTADDVVFTFEDIVNPAYNSPLRSSFAGVDVSKKDDQTVVFTLSENYAPFLGLLTFGIMPQSVWGQIDPRSAPIAEANLKPVGSGPYEFKSLTKDKSGDVKTYTLVANNNYYGKKPFIKDLIFKFYSSSVEAAGALNDNNIDGLGYLVQSDEDSLIAKNSLNFNHLNLTQLKAVFFNQDKNPSLKDVKVRQALSFATPRQEIIDQVEGGNVKAASGPIPEFNYAYNPNIEKYNLDLARASSLLTSAGWQQLTIGASDIAALTAKQASSTLNDDEQARLALGAGTWLYHDQAAATTVKTKTVAPAVRTYLIVNISIIDDAENNQIADLIQSNWQKIGVKTIITAIPVKEIQDNVVKPKKYEALLFSEHVGNDPDVYLFWDSTQAGVNGLNLSNYKNEEADKALEDGRTSLDEKQRITDYQQFQTILNNDAPAIFLFSPTFNFIQNKKIKGFAVKNISQPADRFSDIASWYTKTGERLEW